MQKRDVIAAGVNGGRAQTGDGSADRQTDRWRPNGWTGREAESQAVRQTDGRLAGGQTGGQSEKWEPANREGSGSLKTARFHRVRLVKEPV